MSNSISIFLAEEIGDARLRCAQLKKYIDEAVHMVEKSPQRDHFFEAAGHLLYAIPDTLLRLEKSLSASAMAISKWEYETIKDQLRPEKVEELESALEDTRVRRVQRREKTEPLTMKATEAAQRLTQLAATLEATGKLDTNDLSVLISSLEGSAPKTASSKEGIAASLRELAQGLTSETRPAPSKVASTLRHLVAGYDKLADGPGSEDMSTEAMFDEIRVGAIRAQRMQRAGQYRRAFSELAGIVIQVKNLMTHAGAQMSANLAAKLVMSILRERSVLKPDVVESLSMMAAIKTAKFEEGKPADPTEDMSGEDAKKWKLENLKHKDEFKTASDVGVEKLVDLWNKGQGTPGFEKWFLGKLEDAFDKGHLTQAEFKSLESGAEEFFDPDYKTARFEEGKPSDPTKNMDSEDAAKWKSETEEHKDEFKTAAGKSLTKMQIKKLMTQHKVEGEVRGSGAKWEVELPNDAAYDKFEKHVTKDFGGFSTGYGGWILKPDYKSDEFDFNNPASKHHYAADQDQGDETVEAAGPSIPRTKAKSLVPKINKNKQYASE